MSETRRVTKRMRALRANERLEIAERSNLSNDDLLLLARTFKRAGLVLEIGFRNNRAILYVSRRHVTHSVEEIVAVTSIAPATTSLPKTAGTA